MSPHEWPLYPADLRSGTKVILLRWCNCNCQIIMYMYYVRSCPAHARLPARRVGSGDETTYVWTTNMLNIYESQLRICMTINEHAAYALCSGEVLWLCILLAYRLRGMQLMNHVYILALIIAVQMKSRNPLWNPEIRLKSRNPSRNPLWNPEIRLKSRNLSRNPLWNPEIRFEIQKSALKSRNPLWNPEIHFEIQKFQKSILKSEIHLKSSGFRNLIRRDAPWRTPRF